LKGKLFLVPVIFAILLLSIPAMGQGPVFSFEDTVSVVSISGSAGDTISVPINLKNTFQVGGYLFRITYDTIAFEPVSVDTTSRSSGFEWNGFFEEELGILRFFATSFHPLDNAIPPGTGYISIVNLLVKNGAPGGIYDIRFEDADTNSYDNQLSDSTGETLIIPILIDGTVDVSQTGIDSGPEIPDMFELAQNYPNPFNQETIISFNLPRSGEVDLVVYDLLGRRVVNLYSGYAEAGKTDIKWNGRSSTGDDLSSGVYYYRLSVVEGKTITKRMTLLK